MPKFKFSDIRSTAAYRKLSAAVDKAKAQKIAEEKKRHGVEFSVFVSVRDPTTRRSTGEGLEMTTDSRAKADKAAAQLKKAYAPRVRVVRVPY